MKKMIKKMEEGKPRKKIRECLERCLGRRRDVLVKYWSFNNSASIKYKNS